MKRKNVVISLLAIVILTLPALSFASTYKFIDMSGRWQSVEADTSSMALTTAYQIGVHSGVQLIGSGVNGGVVLGTHTSTPGSGFGNYYQFIDMSGNVQGVRANSPSMALTTAYQIGVHSGVMLVNSPQ